MSRRASTDKLQSTIRSLRVEINRLQKLNNDCRVSNETKIKVSSDYILLKQKQKKEYELLDRREKSRCVFSIVTVFVMFMM